MWLAHCYLEALRSQCVEIHCEQLECVSHDLVREHIQVNVDKVRHLNTCNDKQEDASISKLAHKNGGARGRACNYVKLEFTTNTKTSNTYAQLRVDMLLCTCQVLYF